MINNEECPICHEVHPFQIVEYPEIARIDGETLEYKAVRFVCDRQSVLDEKAQKIIQKENERRVKNALRPIKGLLTQDQIKAIRKKYAMSVEEFASIMGIGVASLKRYETVEWQPEYADNLFRMVDEDPMCMLRCLKYRGKKVSIFLNTFNHVSPPRRAAPNGGNKASLQPAAYWLEAAIVVVESNIIAQRENIGQVLPSAGKTSLDLFYRDKAPSHVIPVCQSPEAVLQIGQGDIMHFDAVAQSPRALKDGNQSRK